MAADVATSQETSPETGNPIANLDVYWKVSAIALAAVAALGIVINILGGNYAYTPDAALMQDVLVFDWTHNVVHVALAALAGAFGFGSFSHEASANTAKVIGVVYIALGVLGFVPAVAGALESLIGLGLEAGENVIHLLLGAWGAYAGFSA
jgi:hypothetical protein